MAGHDVIARVEDATSLQNIARALVRNMQQLAVLTNVDTIIIRRTEIQHDMQLRAGK